MAENDLTPILRTIREVEESLDRRSTRAAGVNLMIWGVVSASIFVFYQLVDWNPGPYHAALGPALSWVWLAPIAVGYVASALVGARLGRFGADHEARRDYRKGMIPGAFATLLAAILLATGRGEIVPSALLVTIGISFFVFGDRRTAIGRACYATAALLVASGVALLLLQPGWTSLAAAIVMGASLLALGTWMYASAR